MQQAIRLLVRRALGLALFCAALFTVFTMIDRPSATDAGAQPAEGVALPVLMYHSLLKDPAQAGPYTVSPAVFEEDMRYLKQQGYTAVLPSQLVAYTQGIGTLPQKPVLITFDDGYYNNYVYAAPILERLGYCAVISTIGGATVEYSQSADKNPNYAYLDWADICELQASGVFEIGNHTFRLHTRAKGRDGVKRKPGESEAAHREALIADVGGLQEAFATHCGFSPITFAYPFGLRDKESDAVLQELGFLVTLTSYERLNTITKDPACLYNLGRFNRPSGVSTGEFMARVLEEKI